MTPESYFCAVTEVSTLSFHYPSQYRLVRFPETKFFKWEVIIYGQSVASGREFISSFLPPDESRLLTLLLVPVLRPISWQFNVISCKIQQSSDILGRFLSSTVCTPSSCSHIKSLFIWPAEISQKQTPEKGPFVCPWCFLFISIFCARSWKREWKKKKKFERENSHQQQLKVEVGLFLVFDGRRQTKFPQ